jgi:RNA polymerase sigma-70 factor (ECF subfamily)
MSERGVESAQETTAGLVEQLPSAAPAERQPRTAATARLGAAEIQRQDELVRRAKAGDADALSQLHAEHAERVYRYFLPRLDGRAEQAEDLTSEVFLRMLQRLGRYESRGLPFSAWLFRIAHNLLVDYVRRQPRDLHLPLDAAQDALAPRGEQELHRVADRCDLTRALNRLTRAQRDVVELRFVVGLSVAEVTVAAGKSQDAVKKLQARGLVALRQLLLDSSGSI